MEKSFILIVKSFRVVLRVNPFENRGAFYSLGPTKWDSLSMLIRNIGSILSKSQGKDHFPSLHTNTHMHIYSSHHSEMSLFRIFKNVPVYIFILKYSKTDTTHEFSFALISHKG